MSELQDRIAANVSPFDEKKVVVDRKNPWFTSNVEFDAINTSIILFLSQKYVFDQSGKLGYTSDRLHNITRSGTTLNWFSIMRLTVENGSARKLVWPFIEEIITIFNFGVKIRLYCTSYCSIPIQRIDAPKLIVCPSFSIFDYLGDIWWTTF